MPNQRARILIVDDEQDMLDTLAGLLQQAGHEPIVEKDAAEAARRVDLDPPDLVITDVRMPELDGVGLLEQVKAAHPEIPVVLMTGYASIDSAVEAMKKGASDYITKPFDPGELLLRVDRALGRSQTREEHPVLWESLGGGGPQPVIIGHSPALREVLAIAKKVAPTDTRVLLEGESGTGKELVARWIHDHSPRRHRPFFAVNCGAFSESLLESELFGYERGAFTGAFAARRGIFDAAHGGSLFLDEICATTMGFQTKLLRVLQEGEFLRVGGNTPLRTDVRILSATNRDPRQSVDKGLFREDLYYRISVVGIHIPPLRQRIDDVSDLVKHFVRLYSRQVGKRIPGVQEDALEALEQYDWPGNVRELQNVIERAVILSPAGKAISRRELPASVLLKKTPLPSPMELVRQTEKELLLKTLEQCRWNRTLAAKKLGIGRRTLYDKLARHNISLRHA